MLDVTRIRLVMDLRSAGVTDVTVLSAIERTPRELFVPEALRDQAYENTALPIACGQTISQPLVVGTMTQELHLNRRMTVLEIGTGSGYQAAILARLCRRVYTIEVHRVLYEDALERFRALQLNNITARLGDGGKGWPEAAPFDRVLLTCAAEEIPQVLLDQLRPDGMMILPLGGQGRVQELMRVTRSGDKVVTERLADVRFVPLVSTVGTG
ncbi:MAG: protein-L-isoaspartate(D-aspartate) O-methyltransferase [Alphaproteobacteria bacterium]|nr:protein-L-isoaspartate(D-aspartate) O-methyltransferase [Alphaproteobacteria bacterium]